ncbi:SDR family NAD(P)-dependent oxidoreductase [Actinoplanes sp. GCM10030250]|uniref:SDR family NAD(P)-dependent oxidoreductase n=1 Tax=Actinoplanes sp. GCM10030250 TaxID=3273376 RepID=UPI0036148B43
MIVVGFAIVTGGGNGLGREISLGLAHAGYGIVVVDADESAARACVRLIEELGVPARALCLDVREPAAATDIVAAAHELGDLRVLVNNAGGWTPQRQYPQASAAERAATINLNLIAPMVLPGGHRGPRPGGRRRDGGGDVGRR